MALLELSPEYQLSTFNRTDLLPTQLRDSVAVLNSILVLFCLLLCLCSLSYKLNNKIQNHFFLVINVLQYKILCLLLGQHQQRLRMQKCISFFKSVNFLLSYIHVMLHSIITSSVHNIMPSSFFLVPIIVATLLI